MALGVRRLRAGKFARQVAAESGDGLTEAIIPALKERFERLEESRAHALAKCARAVVYTETRRIQMHLKTSCSILSIILALLVQSPAANGSGQPGSRTAAPGERSLLLGVQREIQTMLAEVDQNLAAAAKDLARTGLTPPGARSILTRICPTPKYPFLVDCCTVDSRGRILAMEPPAFKSSEGEDISGQEQIVRLHRTKQPVMSRAMAMVEGFDAVDLEQPVMSESGELLGSVSVLIKPEVLFAGVVRPAIEGLPVDIWVMEKDGRILYDANGEEIGGNLFRDALYKPFEELQKLGARISEETSGAGSYAFYQKGSDTVVNKRASWTTVGLHGTEWRLVMIQKAAGEQIEGTGDMAPSAIPELIGALCADARLQSALALNDEAKAIFIFKRLFEEHPGIYSIQWVDASSVNRFGYPPENSLRDYSFQEGRSFGDEQFKAALADRKESILELPLVEGGKGTFYLHPIYSGDRFLGMIYAIRKEPAKAP